MNVNPTLFLNVSLLELLWFVFSSTGFLYAAGNAIDTTLTRRAADLAVPIDGIARESSRIDEVVQYAMCLVQAVILIISVRGMFTENTISSAVYDGWGIIYLLMATAAPISLSGVSWRVRSGRQKIVEMWRAEQALKRGEAESIERNRRWSDRHDKNGKDNGASA